MIKLTATALIHYISPVIQVSENFQKRELVLNDSWERDGQQHPNFVLIEFTGDKMAQLDLFAPGQRVTVEAFINGREYNQRIYNTIKGQSVTPYQPQQQSPSSMGQRPAAAPATYPQQYPQAPAYPQAAPAYPQQQYAPAQQQPQYAPQAPAPGKENLPW